MIYVDQLHRTPGRSGIWCHLASDGGQAELLAFAAALGLLGRLQRGPRHRIAHFDLTARWRALAIAAGAQQVSSRELVKRCRSQS
jgi:hypothetical protein